MSEIKRPLWQHSLWRLVVEQMQPGDLQAIAEEDCGYDVEENLRALRGLTDPETMSFPLPWNPREALALTRWTEPEHADDQQAAQRQRLFAAMALLVCSGDASNAGLDHIIDNLIIAYDASMAVIPHAVSQWSSFLVDLDQCSDEAVQEYWYDEHHLIYLLNCVAAVHQKQPDYDYACIQAHRAFAGAAQARLNWEVGKLRKPWDWPIRICCMSQKQSLWHQYLDATLSQSESAGHAPLIHELHRLRHPDPDWVHAWFMRGWEQEML